VRSDGLCGSSLPRTVRPSAVAPQSPARSFGGVRALALLLTLWPGSAAAQAPPTAITDVTLVPLDRERVLPHRTVLVRDGRIVEIGAAGRVALPPGVTRIDGRGKYLIPGLADLHVHLFDSNDLLLYLANGVTTIRNLGGYGAADSILELRRQVAGGERPGPTIYTSGNWLDGDPPVRRINTVLRTPVEARAEVERQARAGYDFVKVYATLAPDVYREITDAARDTGIPVTGHIPGPVGLEGVLRGGQVAVDHAGQLAGLGEAGRLAARLREGGLSVTTTLVMLRLSLSMRGAPERVYPRSEELMRALDAAGVPLLLGTDAGLWGNVPGFSALEELRLLVESGLTPFRALRAATVAPAEFLNRHVRGADQPGVIAEGGRADLVLLEGNPLEDIAHVQRRAGVMVRGEWFPAERLEALLGTLEVRYAGEGGM